MTDGPLFGSTALTGIVAFSMMICFSGHLVLVLWFGVHEVALGCAFVGPFCLLLEQGVTWQ